MTATPVAIHPQRWDLDGAPPQYATLRNPDRGTYGPEVCQVMRRLGFDPMPWQRYVADVAYEHDETGKLVYRDVVLIVPRQAGKTALVLGAQVHRATKMRKRLKQRQKSIYTAQKHEDARQKLLEDHLPLIEDSAYARFVDPIRKNGAEGLVWSNKSVHHVVAPTAKAGHGGSIDLAQIDEAFSLVSDEVEQGVKPTQITRKSPQFWVVSAAGNQKSTYLRGKLDIGRENVRAGTDRGICYFEWSNDERDRDPADPATWEAVHPAIGYTIEAQDIGSDFRAMKLDEFCRAYLAMWPTSTKPRIVAEPAWAACADVLSECLDPVQFAIDVSPDRSMAAISAAGRRADGALHIEVVRHENDADWVVAAAVDLLGRHRRSKLAVDTIGAAASLLPDLERHKVPVRLLTTNDAARSMGLLLDKIKAGEVRHRDQVSLNAALASADRRKIGDKWAWARGEADITPLVSATLALWCLETAPEPKKFKMGLAV